MSRGGVRPGQGRPSKAEELKVSAQAISAITAKYGSPEEGFKALLNSGEPSLIKWVFEHAYGKPQEKVDVTTKGESINSVQEVIVRDYTKPK